MPTDLNIRKERKIHTEWDTRIVLVIRDHNNGHNVLDDVHDILMEKQKLLQ